MDFVGGFLGFAGKRASLVPNRALRRLVQSHVQFDDLAASPIPGVFPPVEWEGRLLIDGGISNYAPISDAVEHGANTVYVLTSSTACGLERPPKGAIPMLLHSTSFLLTRRLVVDIDHFQDRVELVVLPPPCPVSVPPHDFGQAEELIERSHATAGAFLDGVEPGGSVEIPPHLRLFRAHL